MARFKRKQHHLADEPILHPDHPRPVTRRDFLSAGLISGGAFVMAPTMMNLLSSNAMAATLADCGLGGTLTGRIPFIAFDLSGGANMVGSHIMVGGPGGPFDFFSNAGYRKMQIVLYREMRLGRVFVIRNRSRGPAEANSSGIIPYRVDVARDFGQVPLVGAAATADDVGVG